MVKMNRLSAVLVLIAVAVLAGMCFAQDGISAQNRAQNKLLAYRAARVDAMRKLAERINGLQITSDTSVRDFVADNDDIETRMRAFIRGAREVGKPRYMEDGTCEVTMEVTLRQLVAKLKKLYKEYHRPGSVLRIQDFEKISLKSNKKVIRETGMGAPRPELQEPPMMEVQDADINSFSYLNGPAKAYWMAHCQPRGRLMAVRAARVDAMRKLAERIAGLQITSDTSVRDFVAEDDEINTRLNAFIRGARERSISYHPDELIVEVEMEVTLKQLVAQLKRLYKEYYRRGDRLSIRDIEKLSLRTRKKVIAETGMGVPPERYLKNVPEREVAVLGIARNAPPWAARSLRATGQAALDPSAQSAAQAKLMALRGAELDARRKLAEQVEGLVIQSDTTVRDYVSQNDEIETSVLTFQEGAHVVDGSQRVLDDGTAEVEVELEMRPLWNSILFYMRRYPLR
jgi:hypothetical protein